MTTALPTPAERLALSRERLRQAMTPKEAPARAGTTRTKQPAGLDLFDVLKLAVPSAGLVIDTVKQWWGGQPLRASGNLVEGVADELLRPLAQRHPFTLVAGAVAVGALLVWVRPWRWALKPNMLKTWGLALASSAMASSAVQDWLLNFLTKTAAPQPQAQPQNPSSQPPASTPPQA